MMLCVSDRLNIKLSDLQAIAGCELYGQNFYKKGESVFRLYVFPL
ncbi:MAG: hypothetical protein AAF208_02760 [Cyanobacteria bacterium P01_A01_bin.45]